jgi:hypothetical protein
MRFAILFLCLCTAGFARTWSGFLVDSGCWTSLQTNVNDELTGGQAMNEDVLYCSPRGHTKHFAVVLYDWSKLKLDPRGNVRAAEIVRRAPKHHAVYTVNVNGVLSDKKTIKVASISAHAIKTTY